MSETDPIIELRPRLGAAKTNRPLAPRSPPEHARSQPVTRFDRAELNAILGDYAIDMGAEQATFSIFRRSSECALFRVEKVPKLARKQGAYRVVAAGGQILKRGHDLKRVLEVIDKPLRLVR